MLDPPSPENFHAATRRELVLRRLLLAAHIPLPLLGALGSAIPGRARRQLWSEFSARVAFWSAARRDLDRDEYRRLTRGVPVLMYHAFAARSRGERFIVSEARFRTHLRLLSVLRYRVVSLSELLEALASQQLPRKTVAITIDDGYLDNRQIAAPLLRAGRHPATVFMLSERLGGRNDWDPSGELAGRPLLSIDDALALVRDEIEVGAHTRTHPSLPAASDLAVTTEIAGSRGDLERALGRAVPLFTYPYGKYDDRALAAARAAYDGAFTTSARLVGLDTDPFLIPRIEVRGTDSPLRFVLKLAFGGQ